MNNLFKEFTLEASASTPTGEVAEEMVNEQEVAGEVATVDAEVKNLEGAIETTEDAIQGLEAVKEFAEEKKEEGGLTEGEAKLVQVATEALVARFKGNIQIKHATIESFGAAGNRMKSTDFTIESIGDQLKSMWEAVKRWFKKWSEKMGDWFRAHVSNAGRMKKAAQALADKAGTKHGEKQEDTFKMGVAERRFLTMSDTGAPSVEELVSLAGKQYDAANQTIKQIKAENEKLINEIKAIPVEETAGVKAAEGVTEVAEKKFAAIITDIGGVYGKIAGKVAESDNLMGGMKMKLTATYAPTGTDGDASDNGAKAGTGIIMTASLDYVERDDVKFEDEKDVNATDKSGVIKALGSVMGICDSIMAMQKNESQEASDQKKMEQEIDKIVAKLGKKEGADGLKRVVKNAGKLLSASTKSRANTVRYYTSVARCWLGYSRRCVNNIVDKKE